MSKFQLYYTAMKFDLPWSVRYSRKTGEASINNKQLLNQVYTFWPNGAPCTLVNVWLQSITFRSTGNSADTFAMHISHYIRDSYRHEIQLFEIDDEYLCNFSKRLMDEKKLKDNILHDARNPNHVAYTIRRVLDFLIWYQINYKLASQPRLIGELGTGARVTIEWRIDSRGHPVIHHPAIPTKRPPVGDKKPMPDDFIGKITDTISSLRVQPRHPFGLSKGSKSRQFFAKNEYLYCRRIVTVKLTQLTGLRPDELNNIPLHLNLEPIKTRRLFIPTLKTRRSPPPVREFPLTLEDAIEVSIYLQDRAAFLESLKPTITTSTTSSFLLSHYGTPITTRSLARDFKRICNLSGLLQMQACLSMFRHRFITTHIAYEIKKELKRDLAQKDLWQEAVQRRILAKVAKLTGHTNPMSLHPYFDEAFAIAITNSLARSPQQTEALIASLESSISRLSGHPAFLLEPNLVREIALMEKTLLELKTT